MGPLSAVNEIKSAVVNDSVSEKLPQYKAATGSNSAPMGRGRFSYFNSQRKYARLRDLVIVYKIGPGFRTVSVSYELRHNGNFLSSYA
ncbi:MAG TPA: hypothetical protein VKS21_12205 [Spirochaetota bacterium]|nr:hypothetical protein [Spirochaetota bacterium]